MGLGLFKGRVVERRYRPPLLHRFLNPRRITGNAINGLGETAFRRPRPIYHTFDQFIPHPFMQRR